MNDTALLSAIDRAMRELQVIREAVASRPAPKVALLKALAEANGDSLFVVADVVSPELTASVPSLAAALDHCGARNARALGQLLPP